MPQPGNCPSCGGWGSYNNSFRQVRRCGTCWGTGNAPAQVIREHAARETVFAELEAAGDAKWDARLAFGHLRDHEPERFERLLVSVEHGRVADVAVGLVRYCREEW